jgi:hypothetical protein
MHQRSIVTAQQKSSIRSPPCVVVWTLGIPQKEIAQAERASLMRFQATRRQHVCVIHPKPSGQRCKGGRRITGCHNHALSGDGAGARVKGDVTARRIDALDGRALKDVRATLCRRANQTNAGAIGIELRVATRANRARAIDTRFRTKRRRIKPRCR